MQKIQPSFYSAAKTRLKNYISSTVKQAKVEYMILVVDQQGMQLVCSMFTMVELSLLGLNIIHKLGDASRKPRKYDALYLISCSNSSIEGLLLDFADHRFQNYLGAYVLTLDPLPQASLTKLKSSKNLLTHLLALQQIDMQFFPCQSNVFSLGLRRYFNGSKVEETAQRLASAVLSYWPFDEVELTGSAKMVEAVEKALEDRIKVLKENGLKVAEEKTMKIRVLMVGRAMDWQSPLMRDYHYMPLVYDLYRVKNNLLTLDKEVISLAPMASELFEEIKYLGIEQAGKKVYQKGEQVRNFRNDKQQTLGKLANLNVNIKLRDQIEIHSKIIERINNKEGRELIGLTALEQSIVNGVNAVGQELSDSKLFKLISDFFKEQKTINESDYARLYCLCCMSLKLGKDEHKALMANLPQEFSTLPKKIEKVMPKPKKLKEKPQGEDIQLLFRHQPSIVSVYKSYLNGSLQGYTTKPLSFQQKRIRDKNLLGGSDSGPKLFMFVEGYLGYNEVVALNWIPNPNQRLIIGSSFVVTPYEYVDELLSIAI